jgi:hypothetical protein
MTPPSSGLREKRGELSWRTMRSEMSAPVFGSLHGKHQSFSGEWREKSKHILVAAAAAGLSWCRSNHLAA